MRQK
jgi:DNA repair exonuclease SbcCD ATPase subunit